MTKPEKEAAPIYGIRRDDSLSTMHAEAWVVSRSLDDLCLPAEQFVQGADLDELRAELERRFAHEDPRLRRVLSGYYNAGEVVAAVMRQPFLPYITYQHNAETGRYEGGPAATVAMLEEVLPVGGRPLVLVDAAKHSFHGDATWQESDIAVELFTVDLPSTASTYDGYNRRKNIVRQDWCVARRVPGSGAKRSHAADRRMAVARKKSDRELRTRQLASSYGSFRSNLIGAVEEKMRARFGLSGDFDLTYGTPTADLLKLYRKLGGGVGYRELYGFAAMMGVDDADLPEKCPADWFVAERVLWNRKAKKRKPRKAAVAAG